MILLTGGAGYIGSHTAVELSKAGYDFIIADDFSNSNPSVIDAIQNIIKRKVIAYQINIADVNALDQIFSLYKIDSVIHFAGYKSVGESINKPIHYYRNNIDSTLTLVESMCRHHVNNLIFSSSASVYGVPLSVPICEDAPVGGCSSPYGWTKFFNEQILRDVASSNHDMSVILLRYFNPVGAHESALIGENPRGVPTNLMPYITQVASGQLGYLKIYGNDYPTYDGTGVRDYIHVVDLAKGHIAAMQYAFSHNGINTFNLGAGRGYSVLDVVSAFEITNGVKVPFRFVPRREGDIPICYADTNKAERYLGWHAQKSLSDMCKDAWRWQRTLNNVL